MSDKYLGVWLLGEVHDDTPPKISFLIFHLGKDTTRPDEALPARGNSRPCLVCDQQWTEETRIGDSNLTVATKTDIFTGAGFLIYIYIYLKLFKYICRHVWPKCRKQNNVKKIILASPSPTFTHTRPYTHLHARVHARTHTHTRTLFKRPQPWLAAQAGGRAGSTWACGQTPRSPWLVWPAAGGFYSRWPHSPRWGSRWRCTVPPASSSLQKTQVCEWDVSVCVCMCISTKTSVGKWMFLTLLAMLLLPRHLKLWNDFNSAVLHFAPQVVLSLADSELH